MNRYKQQRWASGFLFAILAACSSTDMNHNTNSTDAGLTNGSNTSSNSNGGSGNTSSTSGYADQNSNGSTSGSTSSTGTSGYGSTNSNMSSASSSGGMTSSQQASYGTVQAIDPMRRQDVGVGSAGAAAVGGSMGSPNDRVWRVNVRMDDGSTQTVVVDSSPSYKVGDRVRYNNGTLTSY